MKTLGLFFRLSRPFFLVGVSVLYALGVGIAHYLGTTINWEVYVLGQAWVTLLQLGTQYLNEYYNALADQGNPNRTFLTGGSGAVGPGRLSRRVPLLLGMGCLGVLASLTALFIIQVRPAPVVYAIMGLAFLGAFFYSAPPLRLESSGYGELTTSVVVAFMVPSFACLLQSREIHLLVMMSVFPLTILHIAMFVALELPDYATDLKNGKRTLLVRMGWQNGMILHNVLILIAFFMVALARSFGFPWFAMVSGLLPLPLGLWQIWTMRNIAAGLKPNWNFMTILAVATFTTMAYFLTIAFWTN
jgi:1,4-dihydroxy-2-naphthoate octaprenyltransferase